MNQRQEFHNKWICPCYDDIIKKISEEKKSLFSLKGIMIRRKSYC